MSSRFHVDNSVDIKLRLIQEWDSSLNSRVNKIKEFDHNLFANDYGYLFVTRPMFNVSEEEQRYASRAIDNWIVETYKNDKEIIDKYEKHNTIPEEIRTMEGVRRKAPKTLLPFFEIYTRMNQNKWCNFQVLDRPIPTYPDIKANVFSGFKVQGPFACNQKEYMVVLSMSGRARDIEKFIAPYRL